MRSGAPANTRQFLPWDYPPSVGLDLFLCSLATPLFRRLRHRHRLRPNESLNQVKIRGDSWHLQLTMDPSLACHGFDFKPDNPLPQEVMFVV